MSGQVTGRMARLQESIAGDALALWALSHDDTVWPLIETLLPAKITHPVLAFNLAGAYALKREKKRMLDLVALALNLGKEPKQFMSDNDFAAYRDDDEFKAALRV